MDTPLSRVSSELTHFKYLFIKYSHLLWIPNTPYEYSRYSQLEWLIRRKLVHFQKLTLFKLMDGNKYLINDSSELMNKTFPGSLRERILACKTFGETSLSEFLYYYRYTNRTRQILTNLMHKMSSSPFCLCLLCQQCLTNESMKPGRLELHLNTKHSVSVNSDLNYFKSLKEKFTKRSTIKSLFTKQTVGVGSTLEAREDLIKPSISVLLKTVMEKDDNVVKAMPLSNNTVTSRRIDEMGEDIETQLVEKLKSTNFSNYAILQIIRNHHFCC
ncbi:unnamed protein product [Lepeophtheirus salmonis]|uniref:(salmon louse) hypothetical protein n=1 Tax=Lepeophtheirus salmonis TaxID=72036 RepID=A0A7R8CTK7_LEPSM|nr:unnamed protein product [Lepeophtheirus salmonis]CAF2927331.1 unnamed protein product [Lepeophtheirus salmonis]